MNVATSPVIARVLKGELCTGCGLCAGVSGGAIKMETVAPGYSRPAQSAAISSDIEAAIATACPGAKVAAWGAAPNRHPMWGPWYQALTGHATEPDMRHAGSSGGVLSALLGHALETGLVDRVLHVTADPSRPTRNVLTWSRSVEQVMAAAGSRYSASSPLESIDAALKEGSSFAFVGKPCDVSALRQLAKVDPRVNAHVPIALSFFCGGLPSHQGADRIIRAMGLAPEDVHSFRYRGNGWPGLTRAETRDGVIGEMRYEDSWGRHLSKEVQFRCKICPDAVGGVADIACADAWYGGESGYPQFEEQDGRSLIMTRTTAGDNLVQSAVDKGVIDVAALPIGEVDLMQPAQARRKTWVQSRVAACAVLLQPRPDMSGLDVDVAARSARLTSRLTNFAGTARRIWRGQR